MKLSRWLPLAIFLALGLLLAAGVWMSRNPDREALIRRWIGKPAPDFSLPSLHEPSRTVTICASCAGKAVRAERVGQLVRGMPGRTPGADPLRRNRACA